MNTYCIEVYHNGKSGLLRKDILKITNLTLVQTHFPEMIKKCQQHLDLP